MSSGFPWHLERAADGLEEIDGRAALRRVEGGDRLAHPICGKRVKHGGIHVAREPRDQGRAVHAPDSATNGTCTNFADSAFACLGRRSYRAVVTGEAWSANACIIARSAPDSRAVETKLRRRSWGEQWPMFAAFARHRSRIMRTCAVLGRPPFALNSGVRIDSSAILTTTLSHQRHCRHHHFPCASPLYFTCGHCTIHCPRELHLNRHRHTLSCLVQGRVVEMDVAVCPGGPAMPEQASRDI